VESDLSQQIAPLPQFSFLEICLRSYGHPFGAMMLNLLGTCTDIRRLKIVMCSEVILQSGYLIYSNNLFKRDVFVCSSDVLFLEIHNEQHLQISFR
jgi:hypothetical protein